MAGAAHGKDIKARLKHEFTTYLWLTAYLYVVFGAIILYKDALLSEQGVAFTPWGIAIVKAAVLAKFLMLAEAMRAGQRRQPRPFPLAVAHRAIALGLVLLLLTVVEEIVVGAFHGRAFATTLDEVFGSRWREVLATCLLLLMALVPYVAMRRVQESVDEATWRRLMRGEE